VRSDDYRQRRKDMDSRSLEYKIAPDVTVEPGDGERGTGGMELDPE
jgi:hypothetical protein